MHATAFLISVSAVLVTVRASADLPSHPEAVPVASFQDDEAASTSSHSAPTMTPHPASSVDKDLEIITALHAVYGAIGDVIPGMTQTKTGRPTTFMTSTTTLALRTSQGQLDSAITGRVFPTGPPPRLRPTPIPWQ